MSTQIICVNPVLPVKQRKMERAYTVEVMWKEGIALCNRCYCEFLVNPPKKSKRAKVMEEKVSISDTRLSEEEVGMSDASLIPT